MYVCVQDWRADVWGASFTQVFIANAVGYVHNMDRPNKKSRNAMIRSEVLKLIRVGDIIGNCKCCMCNQTQINTKILIIIRCL